MSTTPMIRTPTWVSTRRLFDQKLQVLHKSTNLNHIKQLHAQLIKQNIHTDLYVAPKLISAISLCQQVRLALIVFHQVHEPNAHLYNTLIRAHVNNSQPSLAFSTFCVMQIDGIFADNFTYPILLKACNGPLWLPIVKMVHAQLEKNGFFDDIFVPNTLLDTYYKCGSTGVGLAIRLFDVMREKDVVFWNSMRGGLVKNDRLIEARKLFDEMPVRDTGSWNIVIDGYAKAGEMNEAFKLFEKVPDRNVVSWSTMLLGYCKAGDMEMAKNLFNMMPVKNLVAWTKIISAYAEKGLAKEAIDLYEQMEKTGVKPDDGTFIGILVACAESSLLGLGKRIHSSVERTRFKCKVNVSNALVDMYAKCGNVEKALSLFNRMPKKDLISWNCMLQGLAMHGHSEKALQFFSRMKEEGFKPDKITLIGVLCACTLAGLVDKGIQYFNDMERDYETTPRIEHYGCMIILLGRGGRLKEAFELVQNMPFEPNDVIWGTLLGACRMHNEVELAQEVVGWLAKFEQSDGGNYSMLSNIFAATGDWKNVANMRQRMKDSGMQKLSSISSIELENKVYKFSVFDASHPESHKIYQMIRRLRRDMKNKFVQEIL